MPADDDPAAAQRFGAHGDTIALRSLEAMLVAERLPHALLVSGPEGIGKHELALKIAQAVVCQSSPPPCGRCRPCRRIHDPEHPREPIHHTDVSVIQPGGICAESDHDHSNSRAIGICQIRWVEHTTSIKPFEGPSRVVIVDPADALTTDAADAFLKTLEEPPPGVYFLLLTARESVLSETIRSRCRALRLAPLNQRRTEAWLGARLPDHEPDALAQLARLSRGRVGWLDAELEAGDPIAMRSAQIEELLRLSAASRADRLNAAEQLAGRRGQSAPQALDDLLVLLGVWIEWWRDLWLARVGQDAELVHATLREQVRAHAARYAPEQIHQFLNTLQRTRTHLRNGVNARLALEAMLLRIPAATPASSNGA